MKRSGSAVWRGGLKDGKGTVSTDSGVLSSVPYNFDTKATVSLEQVGEGFAVTASYLETTVKIPNADKAKFEKAAEGAKSNCPISKLLNARITLDAKLA